jgi:hypothetical protein
MRPRRVGSWAGLAPFHTKARAVLSGALLYEATMGGSAVSQFPCYLGVKLDRALFDRLIEEAKAAGVGKSTYARQCIEGRLAREVRREKAVPAPAAEC